MGVTTDLNHSKRNDVVSRVTRRSSFSRIYPLPSKACSFLMSVSQKLCALLTIASDLTAARDSELTTASRPKPANRISLVLTGGSGPLVVAGTNVNNSH